MYRTIAGLMIIVVAQASSAQIERRSGALIAADYDYRLDGCAATAPGPAAVVSGRLFVRFQPDQRMAASIDVDVATGADGTPTISAHAINTKGTGSNNGRTTAQVCALQPSPSATISGRRAAIAPVASCSIEGEAVSFSVPVADLAPDAAASNYTGHVTLNKRGADTGARAIAACSSGAPMTVQYDLAVAKK